MCRLSNYLRVGLCAGLLTLLALAWVVSAQPTGSANQKSDPPVQVLLEVARTVPGSPLEKPVRMSAEDFADYLDEQIALIKSNVVLNSALRTPDAAKLAPVKEQNGSSAWLAKRLRIDVIKRTGLVRLAVEGGPPEEQALLANAVAKAYVVEIVQKEQRKLLARLRKLKEYYADCDAKLQAKREALRQVTKKIGDTGPEGELNQQFARQQVQGIEKDILALQAQIRKAKVEIVLAKAAAAEQGKLPPGQVVTLEQRVVALHKAEAVLCAERETRMRAMRPPFNNDAVDLTWLRDEIRMLEEVTQKISRQMERLQLELQAPNRVAIVEDAVVPGK